MNVTTRMLLLTSLLAFGCGRDATSELQAWKKQACACERHVCATEQRSEFWRLVQEFRDDSPSHEESQKLHALIDQGQACLEEMSVDIYAVN
ncbi:MAG: hypothetical protein GY811_12630 [Myxococcales bacterium]|nr:hypothetical protein [Myxococcales bacterium]